MKEDFPKPSQYEKMLEMARVLSDETLGSWLKLPEKFELTEYIMKILIGADLVPTSTNGELFCSGDAAVLVGEELLEILRSADYRMFNLEVPLTDVESPIAKCGPALIAGTDTVAGYKALGVDLLTISNNHIMDQGEQGLFSSIKVLEDNGISYVGAGENLQEAAKPFIVESGDKKIGVYACAEYEFSIAQEDYPGANPFDPLESPDHVAALKAQCDYVIVLYHGGKEHYRYPSPMLQKTCRKLVEKGADLVVCQHSHCVGCEEKYKDGTIVYGQGNFLFDHSKSEFWRTSLLLQVENGQVSYIPLVKTAQTVRLADEQEGQKILNEFNGRSREIEDPQVINQKYTLFAKKMSVQYLTALSGVNMGNIFRRVINKLTKGKWQAARVKRRFTKAKCLKIRNYLECEAHKELLLKGLNRD